MEDAGLTRPLDRFFITGIFHEMQNVTVHVHGQVKYLYSSLLSRNRDHSGIRKRLAAMFKEWRNIC